MLFKAGYVKIAEVDFTIGVMDMDAQEREVKELVKNMSFKEHIKYFWEYHKNHTLFAVLVIFLVLLTVKQIFLKPEYDLVVSYYGKEYFTQEQADILTEYLEDKIDDINNDGEKNIRINIYYVDEMIQNSGASRMAVNQKLTVDAAARVNSVILFDDEYFEYAGPESEADAVESGFNITEYEKIKNMLELKENVYWCQGMLNNNLRDTEKAQRIYNNATVAGEAIKGEI